LKEYTYILLKRGLNLSIHFYRHEEVGERIWREVAARLKMSNEFTDSVALLIKEHLSPSLLSDGFELSGKGEDRKVKLHKKDKGIRRFIRRMKDQKHLDWIFLLSRADITSHRDDIVKEKLDKLDQLQQRVTELQEQEKVQQMKLPTGLGTRIMERYNMKPGPMVGAIMKVLERDMIEGSLDIDNISDKDIDRAALGTLEI
jgi:hypothetical protein